ncbi:MAG: hypothetical protein WCA22_09015 [Candidatus Binatus sp.]
MQKPTARTDQRHWEITSCVSSHPTRRRPESDTRYSFAQAQHLRRILKTYASYYNEVRTHLSLDKDAPKSRRSQKVGRIVAMPILGGLHHQ